MSISQPLHRQESKWLLFFIGLAILVNFSGLFIPIMDFDAGVYASLAKNMVLRNDYVNLFFQGNDWLDKPHFPFWITAFSFKLFGIHTWSYKLPGILFVLIGAYYTYLFARRYYNSTVALWAVFILLTAEHIIISNNDIRAEPFLTGLIIASIYHFSRSVNSKIGWHLIAASFFAACSIMTKGLFTLIPIGGAIAGGLIIKKEWKLVFHWRWLIAILLIALFTIPELYCLWSQFDNHPEKIVFGKTGVSGIRFFLWDSQFGRFTNTGPIKGRGDYFYFLHTLLWAFLPWSLVMYAALINKIRNGIRKTYNKNEEWFTIIGSLFTLLIFSLSRFQLSYYCNIIFPLLAILTAGYLFKIKDSASAIFKIIQNSFSVIILIGGILLLVFYSPVINSYLLLSMVAGLILLLILFPLWLKVNSNISAIYRAGLASLAVNLFLNCFFYPDLLKYQSSTEAAFYINDKYPGVPAGRFNIYAPAFEFYIKDSLLKADTTATKMPTPGRNCILYVTEKELAFIKKQGRPYEIIKELNEFHVAMLTEKFIDKRSRNETLKKYFLVKIL